MITEDELLDREWISQEEIEYLSDKFDLSDKVIANKLGLSVTTWNQYLRQDGIPQKHFKNLIPFFLRQFAEQDEAEDGQPADGKSETDIEQDVDEVEVSDSQLQENEKGQPDESRNTKYASLQEAFSEKFNHLSFDRIIFSAANDNLGEAMKEAAEYSTVIEVPVHVQVKNKVF